SNPIGLSLNLIVGILQKLHLQVYIRPITLPQDKQRIESLKSDSLVQSMLKLNGGNLSSIFAHGFCIYATKNVQPRMILQTVCGEILVTSRPRIEEPDSFMHTVPNMTIVEYKPSGQHFQISTENNVAKIFIRQRSRYLNFEVAIKQMIALFKSGYSIVAEQDDWISIWMEQYRALGFIDFVGAHGVQVSTNSLSQRFGEFNPEIRIFPNYLSQLPPPRNYDEEDRQNTDHSVTIFYGALNRWKDCQEIIPAINALCKKYPNVKIFVIADQKFFGALTTKNKLYFKHEKTGMAYVPYEYYLQTMRKSDIILMPLAENEFNVGKSDIKFLEASAQGVATIASPTVYSDTIEDGKTGFIYHSPEEFRSKLEILITNSKKRREMARAAYDYVKENRMLADHYMERVNWYWDLYRRREELSKGIGHRLEERIPKKYFEPLFREFPQWFSKNFDEIADVNFSEDQIKDAQKSSSSSLMEYLTGGE
ncbi:MAG: glycosyltransferase, partial [Selenomonadaceae bacterium]|nr:glycosyltransferase [Selenomonadaceae bacterium]